MLRVDGTNFGNEPRYSAIKPLQHGNHHAHVVTHRAYIRQHLTLLTSNRR